MKTTKNIFNSFLLLSSALLLSTNIFAQPRQGVPNENAGDNPYTNSGHHGHHGNNGNNGNNGNSGNSGNNGDNGNSGNSGNTGNGNTQPSQNRTSVTNTLNVEVGEFYSLNLSSDNATILLDEESKFLEGSQSTPIQMTVFSSKKYIVKAQVSSEHFNGTAQGTTVNTNNIDLLVAVANANEEATLSSREDMSLKFSEAEEIVSSSKATKADVYNLTYAIPAENTAAFLDQYGKTISTQITYTLLPQ